MRYRSGDQQQNKGARRRMGPPGIAPKSFSQNGPKWCSVLSVGVIGYLASSPETLCECFFVFAWKFCIEKWRGFLVNFFWSLLPTNKARKIRGEFGAKFGAKSGTEIEKMLRRRRHAEKQPGPILKKIRLSKFQACKFQACLKSALLKGVFYPLMCFGGKHALSRQGF